MASRYLIHIFCEYRYGAAKNHKRTKAFYDEQGCGRLCPVPRLFSRFYSKLSQIA
jgi:hypothetical protein